MSGGNYVLLCDDALALAELGFGGAQGRTGEAEGPGGGKGQDVDKVLRSGKKFFSPGPPYDTRISPAPPVRAVT